MANPLEQRARELLAAEYENHGYMDYARYIRSGAVLTNGIVIRAIEAALRLSAGADWQPIETAPKDGTVVMIHERWEDVPIFASWRNGRWYADTSNYDGDAGVYDTICQQNVTHWQPLPAAPRHEPGEAIDGASPEEKK